MYLKPIWIEPPTFKNRDGTNIPVDEQQELIAYWMLERQMRTGICGVCMSTYDNARVYIDACTCCGATIRP